MTPLSEYRELVTRFWKLIDAIILLILSALLLVVAGVTLGCTVFITTFTTGRHIVDRQAARIAAPKEVAT